ncbi:alpha/beta fold hydrolase [Microbacterium sp. KSW-18]|uniref:Alpha/beta fold hydrolase n=1 Tax=Microbacterium aquilitoris TaxID=3067307 RepID=A0ABU3GHT9_9MICO|nr:alpha/beta fold hydrolase [Microbacterium sp. KSW-18]MDT3329099.1 alpha/beta fold hydrolase [Microbacterium sp. KSW-18]
MRLLQRLALGRFYARLPEWVRVIVAVAAVVLGVVIVIRPTTALGVLAWLIGGGMVLTGVLDLTGRDGEGQRPRWRTITGGAWVVGGLIVLLTPGLTVRVVATLVGILLFAAGAAGLVAVFAKGRTLDARIADAAFSISGVIFGVLALFWPDITLLVVAVVFGARLIMSGVTDLWMRLRRRRDTRAERRHEPRRLRRWGRTVTALVSVALAVTTALVTVPLREGSTVVDDFYAAPRDMPGQPGRLIRAEPFTAGIPVSATAWRILYTTTGVEGEVRVASGVVVVPKEGDGKWPIVDWNHGTTGFSESCAPSLQPRGLWSGALYILPTIIRQGWAVVATDYIGLGTEGPHPYLIGPPSATASLDAVRAARELQDADLGTRTVIWGHSQGGAAALWAGSMAREYAPELYVQGVAALAPASDPSALVQNISSVTGGSIFASYAFAAFSSIYDDVSYDEYVRPGADTVLRQMSERCLSDPAIVVSVAASLGMSGDPRLFSEPPASGPLGVHLRENAAPLRQNAPVLLAHGGADSVIPVATQTAFAKRMCSAGQVVDYRVYDGYEHAAVVERPSPLLDELIEWTTARFAGEPGPEKCSTTRK